MKPTKLSGAVLLFLAFASGGVPGAVENIHVCFGNDPRTEATVSWMTRTDLGADSVVQYGSAPEYGNFHSAKSVTLPDKHPDSGAFYYNHGRLSGLDPDTTYHYRCRGDAGWSENCSFRTAPSGPAAFTFAVVGDVQGRSRSAKWKAASDFIAARNVAFWIPVGDLVQEGLIQEQWDHFFSDAAKLCRSIPIMPVIGNHDTYARKNSDAQNPVNYLGQFRLPSNDNPDFEGNWYSFDYGNAHFVVLNAYPFPDDMEKIERPIHRFQQDVISNVQGEWLEEDLAASDRMWKFVSFHPPVYSSASHGLDTLWLRDVWGQTMDKHSVNAVFSGHTHYFQITVPIAAGKRVDSTSDGSVYYNGAGINFSGNTAAYSKAHPLPDKWGNPPWFNAAWADRDRLPLLAIVSVGDERVLITTYNYETGAVYHEMTLHN